jgi:hypothetical protein
MNQEAQDPKAPPTEQPKLREISQEGLKQILEQHRKWVESEKKEGQKADLSNTDLQGALLQGANLEAADLILGNLQGATLTKANLQAAHLYKTNLQGAFLIEANLQRAYLKSAKLDLSQANFREAILQDTKLRKEDDKVETARGLQSKNLAGANVSLATLPEDIHEFQGLEVVAEASRNARKIFISVLAGCVYSWLTIATTTDARLLTNSSSSPLPIIQTPIPIAGFYWAAPFLLLCMFVYLHLYLQRLWEALAELPAFFPDGRPLDKRAYPWLLNGLVRAHFKLLRNYRPMFSRLQTLISIMLAWWVVPATLALFWWRYLPRRDGWLLLLAVLFVAATGFATWFQLSARRTLRGQQRQPLGQQPTTWPAVPRSFMASANGWSRESLGLFPVLCLRFCVPCQGGPRCRPCIASVDSGGYRNVAGRYEERRRFHQARQLDRLQQARGNCPGQRGRP